METSGWGRVPRQEGGGVGDGGTVGFGTKIKQLTKLALTCLYHVGTFLYIDWDQMVSQR